MKKIRIKVSSTPSIDHTNWWYSNDDKEGSTKIVDFMTTGARFFRLVGSLLDKLGGGVNISRDRVVCGSGSCWKGGGLDISEFLWRTEVLFI